MRLTGAGRGSCSSSALMVLLPAPSGPIRATLITVARLRRRRFPSTTPDRRRGGRPPRARPPPPASAVSFPTPPPPPAPGGPPRRRPPFYPSGSARVDGDPRPAALP